MTLWVAQQLILHKKVVVTKIASVIEAEMPELSIRASLERGARQNADLLIEEREIRRYQEPIANGCFGTVYRGTWLNANVAIKCVNATTEDDKKTFWREARIWKKAIHPHIVPFFGAYFHGSNYFLVCKLAVCGSLIDYLKRKQRDENRSLMWRSLYQAVSGLLFLHQRHIVHSDLKCNQILVGEKGEAMLTDFGKSFISDESKPNEGIKGAVNWKAPECLRSKSPSHPTKEADVYSFGMCVVEAVTGSPPWGQLPGIAIIYHLENNTFLNKPKDFTDVQWKFVESLCSFDPSKRLTMVAAVAELKAFSREERNSDEGRDTEEFYEPQPESELDENDRSSW